MTATVMIGDGESRVADSFTEQEPYYTSRPDFRRRHAEYGLLLFYHRAEVWAMDGILAWRGQCALRRKHPISFTE